MKLLMMNSLFSVAVFAVQTQTGHAGGKKPNDERRSYDRRPNERRTNQQRSRSPRRPGRSRSESPQALEVGPFHSDRHLTVAELRTMFEANIRGGLPRAVPTPPDSPSNSNTEDFQATLAGHVPTPFTPPEDDAVSDAIVQASLAQLWTLTNPAEAATLSGPLGVPGTDSCLAALGIFGPGPWPKNAPSQRGPSPAGDNLNDDGKGSSKDIEGEGNKDQGKECGKEGEDDSRQSSRINTWGWYWNSNYWYNKYGKYGDGDGDGGNGKGGSSGSGSNCGGCGGYGRA